MSTIVVNGVPGKGSGRSRTAPRLMLRGRRRKAAQKCLHYLNVIANQDGVEATRADTLNYAPYLVAGTKGSVSFKALVALTQRLTEVLAARG